MENKIEALKLLGALQLNLTNSNIVFINSLIVLQVLEQTSSMQSWKWAIRPRNVQVYGPLKLTWQLKVGAHLLSWYDVTMQDDRK